MWRKTAEIVLTPLCSNYTVRRPDHLSGRGCCWKPRYGKFHSCRRRCITYTALTWNFPKFAGDSRNIHNLNVHYAKSYWKWKPMNNTPRAIMTGGCVINRMYTTILMAAHSSRPSLTVAMAMAMALALGTGQGIFECQINTQSHNIHP